MGDKGDKGDKEDKEDKGEIVFSLLFFSFDFFNPIFKIQNLKSKN